MKVAGVDMFFETSAKTSENVDKAFEQICKQLLLNKMSQKKQSEESGNMKLSKNKD